MFGGAVFPLLATHCLCFFMCRPDSHTSEHAAGVGCQLAAPAEGHRSSPCWLRVRWCWMGAQALLVSST